MTSSRRWTAVAACALASGLSAGCANSSQFTAGRMPYGGGSSLASSAAATQDPFLAQAEAARGAPREDRPAGQAYRGAAVARRDTAAPEGYDYAAAPQGRFASPAHTAGPGAPYQAAYRQPAQPAYGPPAAENPFADAPAAPPAAPVQGAPGPAQWAGYEAPAGPAASNPFAEIEGQPATTQGAITQTSATTDPLPQITPAAGAESWQPRATTTAAYETDEFLPPTR